MSVLDLVEAYALDPTPEGLHALQSAILREPSHDPMLMVSGTVIPLTREDRAQEVVDTIRSWMPGALLSPSAHGYLARALSRLGDEEGSRTESKLSRLALESLAATGAGSREDPCSVLRIEDEYDVLRASSLRSVAQRQVDEERGQFDVHTVEDGDEIWFRLLWLTRPGAEQSGTPRP